MRIKKHFLFFCVFFYCLSSYALTEKEGISFVENYYRLLSEYATTGENLTLARKIEGLHEGDGYVYPDVEINLGNGMTEVEGVKIKSVYLASIIARQSLLLKFVPSNIKLVGNSNGICTMDYNLSVYGGNEQPGRDILKYSVSLKMEIQNKDKKIRSILKRTNNTPPQYTLSVSTSDLSFNASGGTRTITINSNTSWFISINPASWCHITKNGNTLSLQVDAYTGTTDRNDYFKIKAGDKEEKINIKQKAPIDSNQPSAQINSITVSKDQDLDDGKGVIIHVSLSIQNMKDKKVQVSAYFYDNDGNALIDKNNKYYTSDGKVAISKDITPSYEKSKYDDLQIKIPYNELHQSGTHSRNIKFFVIVWDKSVSPNREICRSSYTTFSYQPITEASFLSPSQTNITVSHTGGTRTVTVSTDGPWDFGVRTASWIDLSRSGNTITLDIKRNQDDEDRVDYFTIKSGSLEKRITINQSGDNSPSAEINRVWVNHNIPRTGYNTMYNSFYDLYLGWQQIPYSVPYTYNVMQIHVDFDVNHLKGKKVWVCAFFFYEDGDKVKTTNNQFRAPDGQLTIQDTYNPSYENTHYGDVVLEIPNSVIAKGNYKFYIQIQDSNGSLCSSEYYYFQSN